MDEVENLVVNTGERIVRFVVKTRNYLTFRMILAVVREIVSLNRDPLSVENCRQTNWNAGLTKQKATVSCFTCLFRRGGKT